jgi:hypothetical protein
VSWLAAVLLLSAAVVWAQEQRLDAYPVAPIELPPLERPEIKVERDLLPQGAAGRLPTWDGEIFHVTLPRSEQPPSVDAARQVVDQVLEAFGWTRPMGALQPADPTDRPVADRERLEALIKESSDETRRSLEGRFGRELNEATSAAIREQVELARSLAGRKTTIYRFDQHEGDIGIDNTSLRLLWQEGEGFVSLSGRVFNDVKVGNRRALDANEALKAAVEHVRQSTTVAEAQRASPEPTILPYGSTFLHAWKVTVEAAEGAYEIWVDAANGEVLQLVPMFASNDGEGLVFDPDPNGTTRELGFEVDSPSGGQYRLQLSGVVDVANSGADGVCSGDLTIADPGTGIADFNVAPINGTTVDRTSSAGYNCRFQDVNAFAWVSQHLNTFVSIYGSTAMPSLSLTVNHNNPCGFGIDNACASWGSWSLTFGIGNSTIGSSTSCTVLFNSAVDSTVVTHEFGHLVNHRNNTGTIPQHVDEGMADFWAYTMFDTDTFGGFWGANCAAPSQAGWTPRRVEGQDLFPEHRSLSTSGYGDGQILGWGLWHVRREFNEASALGTLLINSSQLDALSTASFTNSSTDKAVHDNFINLLEELADGYTTSRNVHKVLSGFARAGLFLSPADAVIDIDDDYLDRGSTTGPTFTVWTGRDYTFSGTSVNTASQPFNTRFEVTVSNDSGFSSPVSSGVQSGVVAADGGRASWTLPAADWSTLKTGERLYYKVQTTDATGGNVRESSNPGNSHFPSDVPAPYAVINESGECECTCGASASTSPGAVMVTLVPIAVAAGWMLRLRRRRR